MDPSALLEEITDLAAQLVYLHGRDGREAQAQQTAEHLARAADDYAEWLGKGGFL